MIGPEHWSLWAIESREGTGNLGYPHEVPFYQPARRSDDTPKEFYTTKDSQIAGMIGEGVLKAEEAERVALREFYGAYPGAPTSRKHRIQTLKRKLQRRSVYPVVDRGRKWVEGYVSGRLDFL